MTISLRLPRALLATLAIGLGAGLPIAHAESFPVAVPALDILYREFSLPNGLRVIVHTDRKAPIVALSIWYHVGSKDEQPGKTGFAHLFEHLMFQGSENHKGEYFDPFEQVGATEQNGTTSTDRTNYFENVPTTALDMALWMESDRMGHLLGVIDQAVLDEQRGVVQNEKRQRENQPYGRVRDALARSTYPEGHPYHHTTIGSMNDLNAASLSDVKTWFRSWYGPNNAVLVLAGDIDLATAKTKVLQYFGDIPASATLAVKPAMIAARTQSTRASITDRVAQTRIYKVWNIPQYGAADVERLQLFAEVLGGSRASRLDQRLFFHDKLVDSISASIDVSELGGQFYISADVKQGVDPAQVESAIVEELNRLLAQGPTAAELDQARTVFRAGFIRGIESIGGFGGKADVLAECAVFTGNPGCFRDSLARIQTSTADDVRRAGVHWLSRGDYTLSVVPGEVNPIVESPSVANGKPGDIPPADPKYSVVVTNIDRTKGVPVTTTFPQLKFPALQRGQLSNGIKIILAERHEVPVVEMSMEFSGGFAADQGHKLGTASFTMGMLDEGAGPYDAIALRNRGESLGADIGTGASLDDASVGVSALKDKLDDSLALVADVIRRPHFQQEEIDRVRATWLAAIKQEKTRPSGIASRLLPPLLYGSGHPYAIPFSGTGNEAAIASLSREDLQAWYRDWIRPDNASVIVVGDTTLAEITPLLEKYFADWQVPASDKPTIAIANAALPKLPRVFLVDQPGAVQANILVGQLVGSSMNPATLDFDIANAVLGGEFSSRLNMNLRENKHWAYGAYSWTSPAIGQQPWFASAAVQIDKTAESLQEMQREISAFASGKAATTTAELAKVQATEVRGLPGAFETAGAVLAAISSNIRYDRPDDYVVERKVRIEAMNPAGVQVAAGAIVPNALTWVIVGDLTKIEAGVRALNLGELHVIDVDGKVLK